MRNSPEDVEESTRSSLDDEDEESSSEEVNSSVDYHADDVEDSEGSAEDYTVLGRNSARCSKPWQRTTQRLISFLSGIRHSSGTLYLPFFPGAPRPSPLPTKVPSISMEPPVSRASPISQKTTKLDAVDFPCAVDFIDAVDFLDTVSFLDTAKFRYEVQVLDTITDSICKAFLVQGAFGVTFGIVR